MTNTQHQKKARQAQQKAQRNRDKARAKLLQQRKALAARRARNRRESRQRRADTDTGQRSTAHSTMPSQDTTEQQSVQHAHSTVPAAPAHTTVPARERLYGQRLHAATTGEASADTHDTHAEGPADE